MGKGGSGGEGNQFMATMGHVMGSGRKKRGQGQGNKVMEMQTRPDIDTCG